MFEQPQKQILKELASTLFLIQKPREFSSTFHQLEDSTNQGELLKEINYFCQKLTVKKQKQKPPSPISTKQFLSEEPEQQQVLKTEPQIEEIIQSIDEQPPKPRSTKMLIKQLKFQPEVPSNWITGKIQRKLQQADGRLALNLCIFYSEEDLNSIQFTQLNLFAEVEALKRIQYLRNPGLQSALFPTEFTQRHSQILNHLRYYGVIVCLKDIHSIREVYIRLNQIRCELTNKNLHTRKQKMLQIEEKREIKRLLLKFLQLQTKYHAATNKILQQVANIRQAIKLKMAFAKWHKYNSVQKEKKEFNQLVVDHMEVRKSHIVFRNWKRQIQQQRIIKNIIKRQTLNQWRQSINNLQDTPSKNQVITQFLTEEKDHSSLKKYTTESKYNNDQQNNINEVSEENEDDERLHYSDELEQQQIESQLSNSMILKQQQQQQQLHLMETRLQIRDIQNKLEECEGNVLQKYFYIWRLKYLTNYKHAQLMYILTQSKQQYLLKSLSIGQSNKYSLNLKKQAFTALKMHVIEQSEQKHVKIITNRSNNNEEINKQRSQIEQLSADVYLMNLQKRALLGWRRLSNTSEQIKSVWNSLSDQKLKQDRLVHHLRCEHLIRLKQKCKYFSQWIRIFIRSKQSVKVLKDCKQMTKERAQAQLIRLAFESSMQTQFKWLDYYDTYT